MTLQEFRLKLGDLERIEFVLPSGELIAPHFHITELGRTTKEFVDCGGTCRKESFASLQIWVANDRKHRLAPKKLDAIIASGQKAWDFENMDLRLEYQQSTLGLYGVKFKHGQFHLTSVETACLAAELCMIPAKVTVKAQEMLSSGCSPQGGCC